MVLDSLGDCSESKLTAMQTSAGLTVLLPCSWQQLHDSHSSLLLGRLAEVCFTQTAHPVLMHPEN